MKRELLVFTFALVLGAIGGASLAVQASGPDCGESCGYHAEPGFIDEQGEALEKNEAAVRASKGEKVYEIIPLTVKVKGNRITLNRSGSGHWIAVGQQQGLFCGAQAMMAPKDCITDGECEAQFIREAQHCLDTEIRN